MKIDPSETFEDFALRTYARPAVRAALLALQEDHGVDIVTLLWFLWCAARGETPDPTQATSAVAISRTWMATTVKPLRLVRQRLKIPSRIMPDLAREDTRAAVKAAEMAAEMALIAALASLPAQRDPLACVERAIAVYQSTARVTPDEKAIDTLCDALEA